MRRSLPPSALSIEFGAAEFVEEEWWWLANEWKQSFSRATRYANVGFYGKKAQD